MSRSVWGPCTWYLFHTLAEKIKDEEFDSMKSEIINITKTICNNLPCPSCQEHAKKKMSSLNINAIKTKDDLKYIYFDFHNSVNKRKKKPLFTLEELNNKYRTSKTENIIRFFIQTWSHQYNNPTLMTQGFQRSLFLNTFISWIKTHGFKFNP